MLRQTLLLLLITTTSLFTANYLQAEHGPTIKERPIPLADGFDFPVAAPEGEGFQTSRGVSLRKHLGEDWLRITGSKNSLGAPVSSVADGEVQLARDIHGDWGNVVIVRHAYWEHGLVKYIDSLYAHLDRIKVKEGACVKRGEQVGTIGNNHGMYPTHLHFELHKNLKIGINHTGFARNFRNYWIPKYFIKTHRKLPNHKTKILLPEAHFELPSPFRRGFQRHKKHLIF